MSRLVPQLISWLTGHPHPQQADAEPFERLFHALLLHVVAVSLRFHAVSCGYVRFHAVACGFMQLRAVSCAHHIRANEMFVSWRLTHQRGGDELGVRDDAVLAHVHLRTKAFSGTESMVAARDGTDVRSFVQAKVEGWRAHRFEDSAVAALPGGAPPHGLLELLQRNHASLQMGLGSLLGGRRECRVGFEVSI